MKHTVKSLVFTLLASLLLTACSKDDAYKEFLKEGTKIYPGKALSFKAHSGKNRAKLTWKSIDAKITKFHVYWNNGLDSLIVPARNTGDLVDSVGIIIDKLNEDSYLFKVVSFDAQGNRSIPEEATSNIYSDRYIGSLLNRALKTVNLVNGNALITWSGAEETEVGVEISYTNNAGNAQKMVMSSADTLSTLTDFKKGTPFNYRTLFLPDSTSFDTVSAPSLTGYVYYTLDKSKFAIRKLPTDQGDAWGWPMQFLWDNNLAEGKGYHTPDVAFPYHFTFDLGVTTALHQMVIWQRQSQLYTGANPRTFEIWGSTNPAEDGSFTGWTKLMSCESIKPSGQATGYTAADEAYAKAGEVFSFPQGISEVRFIRFKMFSNWAGKNPGATHIMEVNFIGK